MITLNVTLKHFPWPLVWIFEMVITLKSKKRWEKVAECLDVKRAWCQSSWVGTWSLRKQDLCYRQQGEVAVSFGNCPALTYCTEHKAVCIVHLRAHRCMHVYKWVYEGGGIPDAGVVTGPGFGTCIDSPVQHQRRVSFSISFQAVKWTYKRLCFFTFNFLYGAPW